MFFIECASLASEHRDIADLIERLDGLFAEQTTGSVLAVEDIASILEEPETRISAVFGMLVEDALLREETYLFCVSCDELTEVELHKDGRCSTCEGKLRSVRRYRLTNAIPRSPRQDDAAQSTVVVQFIAGDRGGGQANQLQIPREYKTIEDAVNGAKHREFLSLAQPILAATAGEVGGAYRAEPALLHFGGHGDDRSMRFLVTRQVLPSTELLGPEEIAEIIGCFPAPPPVLVIFNTCHSRDIAAHVAAAAAARYAVGWEGTVADGVAIEFARWFYTHLGYGLSIGQAHGLAKHSCGAGAAVSLFSATGSDPKSESIFGLVRA